MLLTLVIMAGVIVVISGPVLRFIRLRLGAKVELGIALAALGYLLYAWVRLYRFCSAEPTYIAPTQAEGAAGSDGMMLSNCDAPFGAVEYFYLAMVGPGLILIALIFAYRAYARLRPAHTTGHGGSK
jgi:hypothetical protein